jgi:hypothetical protein
MFIYAIGFLIDPANASCVVRIVLSDEGVCPDGLLALSGSLNASDTRVLASETILLSCLCEAYALEGGLQRWTEYLKLW